MADSTINGLTELGTLKENDLMIAWEADAPTNQTKKITAKNARKFSIMEAVCNSAADATTKEIIINANAIPERIAVTFTHGNTAGDTTQQGFTPLKLSIAYNGGSADFDICDSLGKYAGKGFGGGVDGGIIIFQLLSTKALITNSDIRQKDTNYVIKSDGFIDYPIKEGSVKGTTSSSGLISPTLTDSVKKEIIGARCTNRNDDTILIVGSYNRIPYFHVQSYGGVSLPNVYVEIDYLYI